MNEGATCHTTTGESNLIESLLLRDFKRFTFFETNTKMDAIRAVNHHEGGSLTPGLVHHFNDFDLIGFKELFHQNRIMKCNKTSLYTDILGIWSSNKYPLEKVVLVKLVLKHFGK